MLLKSISIFGEEQYIYSLFDENGVFISCSEHNCFKEYKAIYKSTIKSLYILLIILMNEELDVLIVKILAKRNLLNITVSEIVGILDIPLDKYKHIEEGKIRLSLYQRKVVCEKLNIVSVTKDEFIKLNFTLV